MPPPRSTEAHRFSRKEGGEGSAWMARLGAPARRFRRASPVWNETTKNTKGQIIEPRMDTNGPRISFFKGEGRRGEKVVRGWRAWARPHGDSAVRPLWESLPVLYRAAEPPRSTDAHCKVTTHYFLLPSPYSLLWAIHFYTQRTYRNPGSTQFFCSPTIIWAH